MDPHSLTRRRFVVSVIALSGALGSALRPDLLAASRAWAGSNTGLDLSLREAMVRIARLLYTHDALPDDVYAAILDRALADTAASDSFLDHLEAAAAALDEQAGRNWAQLDPDAQVEAMRAVEGTPSFLAIRNRVRTGVYMSPEFWSKIDYRGSFSTLRRSASAGPAARSAPSGRPWVRRFPGPRRPGISNCAPRPWPC